MDSPKSMSLTHDFLFTQSTPPPITKVLFCAYSGMVRNSQFRRIPHRILQPWKKALHIFLCGLLGTLFFWAQTASQIHSFASSFTDRRHDPRLRPSPLSGAVASAHRPPRTEPLTIAVLLKCGGLHDAVPGHPAQSDGPFDTRCICCLKDGTFVWGML